MTITNYVKNVAGAKLDDDAMKNISSPRFELMTHITIKSIQSGTILGAMMIAPIFRTIKGPRTLNAIGASALRGGVIGAGVGLVIGPLLAWQQMGNKTEDGIYDRSYRIRYNRTQVRVDQGWIAGSIIGPCVSGALGGPLQTGFIVGGLSGLLMMTAYNMIISEKK